jgi:protein TonB
MTHEYPSLLTPALVPPKAARTAAPEPALRNSRPLTAAHYPGLPRSRWNIALAILVSAGFHVGILFSVRSHPPRVVRHDEDHLVAISLPMPDLKDLEEPEVIRDDTAEKIDLSNYAPTLTDAPQIALPNAFVQEINFASLIPRPDLTEAKVFVIPANVLHSGKLGEGLGNIFNLADLDHVPEPVVQPSPIFPPSLKREVSYARIVVEFIVDTEGKVLSPIVIDASFPGFEDAAMSGVSRWRFRPGMKGGRRVNTRMSVPILFRIREES